VAAAKGLCARTELLITPGFARIHEVNLNKQAVLALTFADPSTYETIAESDKISVLAWPTWLPTHR
jgi:aconitate hydratase